MSLEVFQQSKIHADGTRSGFLNTRLGPIATPFFMPVATRGVVKGVPTEMVKRGGAQVLLSNTYHLHLQPGEELVNKLGDLHKFNRWRGPILTDSGGFQIFSLAHARKITEEGVTFKDPRTGNSVFISPEISVQIQLELGSDIIMAFDDLTGLGLKDRPRTEEAMLRTHRWLERCISEFERLTKDLRKRPLLFGIVQGGLDRELRQASLDFIQSTPVDGIAIGGLSVGESRREMHAMLDFLAPAYDPTKIRYLMGVGDPVDFKYALSRGIDMMDCVMPSRNGRHGSVWLGKKAKKINLKSAVFAADPSVIEKECDCYACHKGYSRALIRHLFKVEDPLAGTLCTLHNLRYLHRITEQYR